MLLRYYNINHKLDVSICTWAKKRVGEAPIEKHMYKLQHQSEFSSKLLGSKLVNQM